MTSTVPHQVSPFLDPGRRTKADSLAILQLSRDDFVPVYLQSTVGEHDGYAEGAVTNTRFGSFPHSTLLNVPWGSQIRASKVDTGSRGRKRKRGVTEEADGPSSEATENVVAEKEDGTANGTTKQAVADSSGFIHILPPTPEIWTTSLPHRTQVVYTPDYSYILQRIRARPGTTIIEAGAGSGSFTHASVRAVYNGYPGDGKRKGKVVSFEFNEERYHKMKKEILDHGLEGLVTLTHRDVYRDGFLLDGKSPEADAVFLDLPAPWEALPHLTRRGGKDGETERVSPLHPKKTVHICTFSPCIEQVTRTVSTLRHLGWVDIEMVEIAHRKLHTLRERVGLNLPVDRGVNNSPRDVEEALGRLAEIEERLRETIARPRTDGDDEDMEDEKPAVDAEKKMDAPELLKYMWQDGRLVTRMEPEIKSHTSYLVFAVLPVEWTAEDEAAALEKYPVGGEQKVVGQLDRKTRKEERRQLLEQQKANKSGGKRARRKARDERIAATSGDPA
ncbi:tRNA methyltransferase complex GCD14 subunit-domain-containing protein [Echria macrotheca]|uniref:tRNA (adenine(58)-N(1))-methyltransferase catalytic subunit TRM61 n=1 Tax=Echria macrotheca TaxID=438768 RepID=A0AAJ0BPJ3_9PEZI|nr:tRNA methyltransferase complex GCD14 subunit-domain-containing protein [Echria macrotheca]